MTKTFTKLRMTSRRYPAYQEGFRAFEAGQTADANPYAEDTTPAESEYRMSGPDKAHQWTWGFTTRAELEAGR